MIEMRSTIAGLFSLVAVLIAVNLFAQSAPAPSAVPDLNGTWTGRGCIPKNSDVCPDFNRPTVVTERAKAFQAAFDELAVPKYDCFPATIPALLTDPYPFLIEQQPDRVTFTYEKDDVVRVVWLDGRGHAKPKIGEFFAQGYSTGRYEKDQLVVDTTKFVFDPTGIDDDFGNLPSSTKKHLVERYYRAGDRLRVDLTIEDPVFLKAPVTYTIEWQRSKTPPSLPWDCDPAAASEALKFRTTKYPEPK